MREKPLKVSPSVVVAAVLLGAGLTLIAVTVYDTGFPSYMMETNSEQEEMNRTWKPVDSETPTLRFTVGQAAAFNDVYTRRNREWSWCLDINESGAVTEMRLPLNTSTTHDSVSYWCQKGVEGTVHTHPSGNPALSHADRVSSYQFSCLVYDRVPERWFENPHGLDCYRHLGGDRVDEIDVLIR